VIDHIGVVKLAELNPTGRAGGDHRKLAAVLYSLKKLGSLFYDSEVCRGICVKYLLETKSAKSGNHLALNVSTDRHIEALAKSRSDRGSGLNYNVLGGISKSCPNLVGIITLYKSAGGTYSGTLTAGDTGGLVKRKVERLTDAGINTTVVSADNRNKLFLTNRNTSTAKDTLVVISYEVRGRVVKLVGRLESLECMRIYTVLKAKLLKLAIGRTRAGETVHIVGGKNKLKGSLSCSSNLGGVSLDSHALGYGVNAGGNKTASTCSLNNTDTASADLILFLHIAESRNFYTCRTGSLKNSSALGYAYSNTVNSYI
jgi:hypothetical protein